ncbi:DUF4405 domain-containing protein [Methanosarcina siciliae]|uniref:DUF4405 domain-containing protein n=1 Tax=Methanosarcina siciliae TaxID=38027 RepID=UPI0009E5664C|nr:DUF4405 domain-containing protein [Methanosarcina siciliae]
MNRQKTNYSVDLVLTTLFFIVAFTGLYMHYFIPSGIQRGRYVVYMGLTKATWIWIHSKAGILMTILVIIHFILHWKWIVCTTKNFFRKEQCELEKAD